MEKKILQRSCFHLRKTYLELYSYFRFGTFFWLTLIIFFFSSFPLETGERWEGKREKTENIKYYSYSNFRKQGIKTKLGNKTWQHLNTLPLLPYDTPQPSSILPIVFPVLKYTGPKKSPVLDFLPST